MTIHEGTRPDQTAQDIPPPRNRVHHVRAGELDGNTAISGTLVGSGHCGWVRCTTGR